MSFVKHGMWGTPEYRAWQSMKSRCLNPCHAGYMRYGGRGISVCAEWVSSFEAFLAHVGRRPSPGQSLDRINNEGNYEPGNVRWATASEQASNRRVRRICRNGLHEYTPENTLWEAGARRCRECRRIRRNKNGPQVEASA